MAEPTVSKLSVSDFNNMQDLVMVVDNTSANGDNVGKVDEGDTFYAQEAFGAYKKDDKVPFSDARIKAFRENPDAYRTIRLNDKEAMTALAKEYGLTISEPKARSRCGCEFGVSVGGSYVKDVHIDSLDDNTMNLAVVRYEFSKIVGALKFEVKLPAEVAVRMAQFGVSYDSNNGLLNFRPDIKKNQTLFDEAHPTTSAVFELAPEADCIFLTVSDDQGTKKYKVYLGFGSLSEVK